MDDFYLYAEYYSSGFTDEQITVSNSAYGLLIENDTMMLDTDNVGIQFETSPHMDQEQTSILVDAYGLEAFSQMQYLTEQEAGSSMTSLNEQRRRDKAGLCPEQWEYYKPRICELFLQQNLPLSQIKQAIEDEFGTTIEYELSYTTTFARLLTYGQVTPLSTTNEPVGVSREYNPKRDAPCLTVMSKEKAY